MFEELFYQTLSSFIPLFIILDPFLGLVVFIHLTKGMDRKEKAKQALTAVSVALGLLIVFLFSGIYILEVLGIEFSSFRVAGGVILLILGIQAVLGIEFSKKKHSDKVAAVIIGTPLLCGPGVLTTVIILSQQYGFLPPLIASFVALFITWVMLFFSEKISEAIGEQFVEIMSRILGLILAALAAEFIKDGIIGMIKGG